MRKNLLAATLGAAFIGSLAVTPALADDADKATPVRAEGGQSDRSMGEVVDDAAIVAKVKSSLLSSSEVEGLDVNVDARNGVVTLSGTADTMAERSSAERIAKSADGVKSVDNKIVIKSGADADADANRSNADSTRMNAPSPAAPAPDPANRVQPAN